MIMGSSLRSANQGAQHADYVYSVVEEADPSSRAEEFSASWERSIRKYGLDPAGEPVPRVLTPAELREQLEPVEEFIRSARDEIDQLYNTVRAAGYAVLLSDSSGVAVDLRGEVMPASHLKDLGSCVGGVWSEEVHGTKGIGTCVAEERPITVHRAQHFRSRHTHLSCSGAPIFGLDGKLLVLDLSSVDPRLSEHAHALTGTLTTRVARAIEERFFREQFRGQWVVAIASRGDRAGALLAVDGDQRILGANRAARASLSLDDQKLQNGIGLWSVFRRNAECFRARHNSDFFVQLAAAGTDEMRSALITPPYNHRASLVLHARPRFDLLEAMAMPEPLRPVHGGLAPGTFRRVRTYIEEHLTERIQLADLAAVAGLSVYHFAREFKRTVGVAPHSYVTRRRVEKAQEMLARTDLSLSDVALASGFFDQSHLSRHFREFAGVTPAEYRWSQR
jgi:transcriptional regulator of acetoin/glycerol metabolism/AraC-like DNA-binding protein